MKILLTNDDGIYAKGLNVLKNILKKIPNIEVTLISTKTNCSGFGRKISVFEPIVFRAIEDDVFIMSGTPIDGVKIAFHSTKINKGKPFDLVIAGINHGLNIGQNIHYSGTVSIIQEALTYGISSVSFSIDNHHSDCDFTPIVDTVHSLLTKIITNHHKNKTYCLNINLPNKINDEKTIFRFAPPAELEYYGEIKERYNKFPAFYYWLTELPYREKLEKKNMGSDINIVKKGLVAITPLNCSLKEIEDMQIF